MSEHDHTCGCETKNPLQRDGTSQTERLLSALDPSFVKVDEREIDDLLRFALKHAEKLNFYDNSDNVNGDWYNFLAKDVSVLCANISGADLDPLVKDFRTAFAKIDVMAKEETASDIEVEDALKALYSPLVTLINLLGKWHDLCDEKLLLRSDLSLYFTSVFSSGFIRFREIDAAAAADGIISAPAALDGISLNSDWTAAISVAVTANSSVFSGLTAATHNSKYALAASFYIRGIFDEFYMALLNIISRAPDYLAKSLNEYPWHKAQAGLFLAFIQLFGYAQQHLNKLTQRHLDFYFDRVLQLQRKPAVADSVHLIFELAANAAQYEIPEGTLLKAGKDALGKPLSYSTDDTLVFNKAQAVEFKSIYIQRNKLTSGSEQTRLYASPVANSSDGKGAPLDSTLPQWEAFGSPQYSDDDDFAPELTMPNATIGFAIASPQLVLREGTRNITVIIELDASLNISEQEEADLWKAFKCEITGAKGWMDISPAEKLKARIGNSGKKLLFILALDNTMPATAAWDAKVHLGNYNATTWPVLRITMLNTEEKGNIWHKIQKAAFTAIKVETEVSDYQSVIIQNDAFVGDPAKPFQPFGVLAPKGAAFYIGSDEILYKPLNRLTVKLDWHDVPEPASTLNEDFKQHYKTYFDALGGTNTIGNNDTSFKAKVEYLSGRSWKPISVNPVSGTSTGNAYTYTNGEVTLFQPIATNPQTFIFQASTHKPYIFDQLPPKEDEYATLKEYNTTVQRGFIRFTLIGQDFRHNRYASALMKAAAKKIPPVINQPYTPLFKSISVSYTSDRKLSHEYDQFFRIHPFGEEPVENFDTGAESLSKQTLVSSASTVNELIGEASGIVLLPQYTIMQDIADSPLQIERRLEGLLHIGLSGLKAPESVSMLIQTVDDSADPNQNQPEVIWSYLRNNNWVELDQSQLISDTTNGFLNSGIIELGIPEDISSNNSILTSGLYWLRAATVLKESEAIDDSVLTTPGSTSALSNVLNIHTQAIKASFRDNGNDPNHLRTSLSAETISKLENSISAVKSVKQPYSSFGGKLSEAGNEYYRRVSERLRHKGRAITMWDYERLVLENHPSIYKVKCINHMRYRSIDSKPCYNQMAGGGVTVIVVSNLRNQNLVNPLQPTTSNAMRTEIETMLKKRSSRFAEIKVINPKYEEIKVKFRVYFGKQWSSDKGYYSAQLNEDIKKFLSPWAYDEGSDIRFGGKLHASFILNFIEEREYVDYITDFTLFKLDEDGNEGQPLEEVSASEVYSILVSATQHEISY
ncbi:MAG: baseplate J/gp47 family protein [Bacteroidota bacterium]